MKKLACIVTLCAVLLGATFASAQDPKPPSIKGTLDINYRTRVETTAAGKAQPGMKDIYSYNLDVAELFNFSGAAEALPTLFSSTLGRETQGAQIAYNLALAVRNPANLTQIRTIGKLVGIVPIDKTGVYQYDKGNLRLAVNATGTAKALESAFRGQAAGKPPKNESTVERAKKKAETIKRQYQGKVMAITMTDYDKMAFSNLILPAGPIASMYPETTVNGEMIYDYDRSVWFFNGVTMAYVGADGKNATDRISGNIKWVEDANRKANGKGQYDFDVRVNEPEAAGGETAFFQKGADESAFFAVDNTLAALTGTAVYQDTLQGTTTVKSAVKIDLAGSKLTKLQVFNLAKILWFVEVVPMNSD